VAVGAYLVQGYEGAVTKQINIARNPSGFKVWQRNYYERILLSDMELKRINEYIRNNPLKWHEKD
jgi:REP element-mobilizing transposase RayT